MLPTLVYSTKQTTLQPTLMATESTDIQVQHKTYYPSTHLDDRKVYWHTGTAQNRPPFNPPWWPQSVLTYRYSTKQTTLQPTLMATVYWQVQHKTDHPSTHLDGLKVYWQTGTAQNRPPFNPPLMASKCTDIQVQHKTDHPSTHLDGLKVYWHTGTAQNRPPFNPPWWPQSVLTYRYSTKQTTLQPTLMASKCTDRQVQHKTDHPSTHLDGSGVYWHTGTAQNRPPFNPPWWPQRVLTYRYSTKQTTLQPTLMAVESIDIQVQHKTDHPSTHLDGSGVYWHTGTAQNRPPFNPPWWPQRVLTYRYSTKQTTFQPTLVTTESTDRQVQHKTDDLSTHLDDRREYWHTGPAQNRPPFSPPWWPQCTDRQVQHKTDHPSTHLDGLKVYWHTGTAQNRPPFNPPWWPQCIDIQVQHKKTTLQPTLMAVESIDIQVQHKTDDPSTHLGDHREYWHTGTAQKDDPSTHLGDHREYWHTGTAQNRPPFSPPWWQRSVLTCAPAAAVWFQNSGRSECMLTDHWLLKMGPRRPLGPGGWGDGWSAPQRWNSHSDREDTGTACWIRACDGGPATPLSCIARSQSIYMQ